MKKLLLALLLIPILAFAWEPTKPITVIVGFAPGSGNELAFRQVSSIVQKNNPKVNFIVENKPGADAVIAQNYMLTVPADGYTVSVPSHMSLFVTNDIWQKDVKKFKWDTFTNVATLGKSPLVLVVNSRSPVDTPEMFKGLVKMGYRPVNIAIGGGAHQMAYEYIMNQVGSNDQVQMIKYQGPLQAVTAVAGDQTEFGIMPIAVARPLIEAGKVKVIGLTTDKKLDNYPLLNQAFPGIEVYAGWMVSLPPNTPQDIIDWYQKEFSLAIKSQEYRQWAKQNQILVVDNELSPAGTLNYGKKLRSTFTSIINNNNLSK